MRKTGDVLIELGITPELKGFQYIIDMIEEIRKESGGVGKITALYAAVGKKNHATGSKVERDIRHAIDTRLNMATEEYRKYVGAYPERLTNSAFLYALKYRLENMED